MWVKQLIDPFRLGLHLFLEVGLDILKLVADLFEMEVEWLHEVTIADTVDNRRIRQDLFDIP